ncbi:MAG: hypothetical protein Q4P18_03200 [Methanobrevibacter sp.]|uniref:hypothetical protein n=1 Tax=Methanobrevibacter sp. TaxID=66852 RepID=UPI0026E01F89|nr:hypothetical protein [Methanobrevibacter sp.]MDO5848519.1 hypothetical protein [Methanobrevibacter sp.]
MAVNFDFLKESNPELYEIGHGMEENFFKNTKASAQCGSKFLNALVKEIYEKNGLEYVSKSFMTKDIAELAEKGIIDEETAGEFEKAKIIRDEIMDKDAFDYDRVLALHSVLVVLASKFHNKYN